MRASYYHGNQTFKTGPAPMPTAQAGEALLRVRRVGICGTDLHIFQGHLDHRVPAGGVIGHETFAEVVEAPAGSGFAAGDRVVVEPLLSAATAAPAAWARLPLLPAQGPGRGRAGRHAGVLGGAHGAPASRCRTRSATTTRPSSSRWRSPPTTCARRGEGGRCCGRLRRRPDRRPHRARRPHRGARVIVLRGQPVPHGPAEGSGSRLRPDPGPPAGTWSASRAWTGGDGADVAFEVTGNPAAVRLITERRAGLGHGQHRGHPRRADAREPLSDVRP